MAIKIHPQKAVTTDPHADAGRSEIVNEPVIAALAYALWQERGCPIGSPELDWFQAEDEVRRLNG
jgi:hypothetical protein